MKGDKEGHYIMIKGSVQEEDITPINIYAPNIGAPQYVRQMLTSMKAEISNNTIIMGDFKKNKICLFLLLFPIFWEVGHIGSCCDVCRRVFCLCSPLGVL